MIYLKTEEEIELLRRANLLVSATLAEIAKLLSQELQPVGWTPWLSNLFVTTVQSRRSKDFLIPTVRLSPHRYARVSIK